MATTIEGKIFEALMKRAATLPVGLPVAWPNVNFEPPKAPNGSALPFLRVDYIPNTTERQWIASDGVHRYIGILQVSVMWPKNAGETQPREMAGQIIAHFPCDLRLVEDDVEVRISKRPEAADLLQEGSDSMIAVSIEYECFA